MRLLRTALLFLIAISAGPATLPFGPEIRWNAASTQICISPCNGLGCDCAGNCFTEACRQWKAASEAPPPTDPQSIIHHFRSGDHMLAERGFGSASIVLRYRFISCFGEIHIAYSMDPKSLTTSDTYYIRVNGRKQAVRPAPAGVAPESIPIDFDVRYNGIMTVATIRDNIAGRALGMGCFTGDTRKLGLVKDLIGPRATNAQIKEYMSKLHIGRVQSDIPFALTGTREPVLTPEDRARKLAAEDDAKVNTLNGDALRAARDQSAKIDAQLAANKKAQADYQTALDNNRRQVDAINADNIRKREEYAAQQRAYQERLATHAACSRGDKAACARYNAGQ